MAGGQQAWPLPTGLVPAARMAEWFQLKQQQDNTRREFERRVADARQQLHERHLREDHAFLSGQSQGAGQAPTNAIPPGRPAIRHEPVQEVLHSSGSQVPRSDLDNPVHHYRAAVQGQPATPTNNLRLPTPARAVPPAATLARPSLTVQHQVCELVDHSHEEKHRLIMISAHLSCSQGHSPHLTVEPALPLGRRMLNSSTFAQMMGMSDPVPPLRHRNSGHWVTLQMRVGACSRSSGMKLRFVVLSI